MAIRAQGSESHAQATLQAIGLWRTALDSFIEAYGFGYTKLSELRFDVSTFPTATGDIVIKFTSDPEARRLGVTGDTWYPDRGVWDKAEITLYLNNLPTRDDVASVAAHEFGHALGLGHAGAKFTDDGLKELMYEERTPGSPLEYPSTLDVYAVAKYYFGGASYKNTVTLPRGVPHNAIAGIEAVTDYEGELRSQIEKLKTDYDKLLGDHSSLKSDYGTLNSRHARLQTDFQALTARFDDIRRSNDKLNTDLTSLTVIVQTQKIDLDQRQTTIGMLQIDKERLTEDLDISSKSLVETSRELEQVRLILYGSTTLSVVTVTILAFFLVRLRRSTSMLMTH